VIQDLALELAEMHPRFKPELVRKPMPRGPEDLERLGLSPAAIQREHQLPEEAFPERVLANEPFELGHELRATTECKVGFDPVLEGREALLLESLGLERGEGLVEQVRERGPAPETERAPQRGCGLVYVVSCQMFAALGEQSFEAGEVELVRLKTDEVARRLAVDAIRTDDLAEARDVVVERMRRARRRPFPPQAVDQAIAGDDLVRVEQEDREERALLRPSERKLTTVVPYLDGAENSELHYEYLSTVPSRLRAVSEAAAACSRAIEKGVAVSARARLLAHIVLTFFIAVSFAASARAGQPTFTKIAVDDTVLLPLTSAACGFPVFEHDTGTVTLMETTLPDGSVKFHDIAVHVVYTFFSTDPAHPGSVTARPSGPAIEIDHPDGSITIRFIGQDGQVTIPGQGIVFAAAGIVRIDIDPSGTVTEIQHGNFSPDHSGICPLL
jgi:hypothetical protein